ncbi:MAG: phenylalanine--tRNA ligase subunit alpha [Saprospiraceae bacterium]|nr:phenylalanine--tRNA ligase subunit alpha [Saprospiraceae bacterium]
MSEKFFSEVDALLAEIESTNVSSTEELEAFRIAYLGSKNRIKPLFAKMRDVEADQRKAFGLLLNKTKQRAEEKYAEIEKSLSQNNRAQEGAHIDLTAPGYPTPVGARHPVSIVLNQIVQIFERLGFQVVENREIEDEWHNFTALNTPEDHPARDMTDTYYLKFDPSRVLRSQTSTVQVHEMEDKQPPIRIISPGRVYRNETISARAHCQFHQVEGLYVDEDVSFADMKQVLFHFARELYGEGVKFRLRPSYFPFTEPSAEMDVYWGLKTDEDYRMTKGTGWLEIMGCGMVDPNVLDLCGIDSEKYSGFAFGMGLERQAMRKYKISDIRHLYENDVRFLRQFKSAF